MDPYTIIVIMLLLYIDGSFLNVYTQNYMIKNISFCICKILFKIFHLLISYCQNEVLVLLSD